jgi:hypothetical protein
LIGFTSWITGERKVGVKTYRQYSTGVFCTVLAGSKDGYMRSNHVLFPHALCAV